MYVDLIVLIVLILLNAFFAASEIALISLNDNKVKLMSKEGNNDYTMLEKMLSEPSKFLATIQIGITLAGFLASAFASEAFSQKLIEILSSIDIPISKIVLKNISLILITLILSYFTLVFGELVPKRIAMKKAEIVAESVIRPLSFLMKITYPFVKFLTFSTNIIVRIFGINPNEKDEKVTEEEIRMMIDVGEETGTIEENEKIMLNNVFELSDKSVSTAMTHRIDIAAISEEMDFEEIISFIKKEKYSRIPVYKESIDNIVGVLYSKDMIDFLIDGGNKNNFVLKNIIRMPYFVTVFTKIDELLKSFQNTKRHFAIVIDEYGGTAGVVTMEDLLEEIVGNILDEYDVDEKMIEKIGDNSYIVNGLVSLVELKNSIDVTLPTNESDTISGFIVSKLGNIPAKRDRVKLEYGNYKFIVLESDEKRILKVKIEIETV